MTTKVGPVRLVIFDWAGTTVDHGCFGPLAAFRSAFQAFGVEVSAAEARIPMGLGKRDHSAALLRLQGIAQRWRCAQGEDPTDADVEAVYQRFIPLQLQTVGEHCKLVAEAMPCVAALRARGVRIGATTGYFRAAAERVRQAASEQGYKPDVCLCPDDVPEGRPAPWMIFRIMETLNIYPAPEVFKVGDTEVDMAEGRNAGVWCVGVLRSSSLVGCTEGRWNAMPARERAELQSDAARRLLDAGAHAVVENLAELP
ncbi:MAG: phosphonoacetaldehyde hydrolase, partial [Candidatus Acidiferrum sp.]